MLQYILRYEEKIEPRELSFQIDHYLTKTETLNMASAAEKLLQEGGQQMAHIIANNMLEEGAEETFIAKVTKLSLEEIEKLKSSQS
jgi:hypothetical protein